MDFRCISKCTNHLLQPSTVVTPQLEDYDLLDGYRELQVVPYPEEEQRFMVVLNLATVDKSELKLTRVIKNDTSHEKDVLQVEVNHQMKEIADEFIFERMCSYRYVLPETVSYQPLTALWTADHHLIVVETSNLNREDIKVDDPLPVEDGMTTIQPEPVNYLYRSVVKADILRHSLSLAEHDLGSARRMIQHNSFDRPLAGTVPGTKKIITEDIAEQSLKLEENRPQNLKPSKQPQPDNKAESDNKAEFDNKAESVFIKPELINQCLDQLQYLMNTVDEAVDEKNAECESAVHRRMKNS